MAKRIRNTKTEETRLIVGSANLSYQAFDKRRNQFEDILIFDHSNLYQEFRKHFEQDILSVVSDYLPKILITKVKKAKTASTFDEVIFLTDKDKEEIGLAEKNNVVKHLQKDFQAKVIEATVLEKLDDIGNQVKLNIKQRKKNKPKKVVAVTIINFLGLLKHTYAI